MIFKSRLQRLKKIQIFEVSMQQNYVLTKGVPQNVPKFRFKFEWTLKNGSGVLATLYYILGCIMTELQTGQIFVIRFEDQCGSFFVAVSLFKL